MAKDPEEQHRRADDEPPIISPPVISTPINGRKRWIEETWGKIVAYVVGPLLLGALYWLGGRAIALGTATSEVYTLPPRVKAIEEWKAALPSPAPTITEDKADRLIKLLEAEATARAKAPRRTP